MGTIFMNCVELYDYDAADIMDDDNFATVLEILSLYYPYEYHK